MINTVIESTRSEVAGMDTRQRIGFGLACAATIGRGLCVPAVLAKSSREPWNFRDTTLGGVMFLSDCVDGRIARATDAVTTFGKVADPYIDKLSTAAAELKLLRRRELSIGDVAIRVARDYLVSSERKKVYEDTGGQANVAATSAGKVSSAVRMTADVISMSPLSERFPRTADCLQSIATIGLIASGVYTVAQLSKERSLYSSETQVIN